MLPLVRFSGPLAEPVVRVSAQRAFRGCCRQALSVAGQGLGMVVPRQRWWVTGVAAIGWCSVPSAVTGNQVPVGVVNRLRMAVSSSGAVA